MRGSIIKRSNSSYTLVIPIVDPVTGKTKQKWITVKGKGKAGQKKAEDTLTQYVNEVNHGSFVEPSKLTVSAFLDKYISIHAEQNVAATTLARYKSIIEHHLKPALGGLPLVRLTPIHLQEFYAKLAKGGRKDDHEGGLSAQTILHTHRLISAALTKAVKWQLLARNPADAVDPPKVRAREMLVLDAAGTARLITAAAGTTLHLPILLAVCCGLRRGEILGLRWTDLDEAAAILYVRRALEETKACGVGFKEPKGRRARKVALPTMALTNLRFRRDEQRVLKEQLGADYHDDGLVCCHQDGTLWAPSAFTSAYRALLKRRKLAGPNFHALRHGHASHLLTSGVDIKAVSERLGHSRASFTLAQYCHMLPGQDQEAARRIEETLQKAMGEIGKKATDVRGATNSNAAPVLNHYM
jgi:integrase